MTDLRDVTVDELFSWRQNTGYQALTLLDNRGCANQKTYDEIKSRCGRVEVVKDWVTYYKHFHEFEISVDESVPDGVIRPRKLVGKIV